MHTLTGIVSNDEICKDFCFFPYVFVYLNFLVYVKIKKFMLTLLGESWYRSLGLE